MRRLGMRRLGMLSPGMLSLGMLSLGMLSLGMRRLAGLGRVLEAVSAVSAQAGRRWGGDWEAKQC
jgi:hypothetical protein